MVEGKLRALSDQAEKTCIGNLVMGLLNDQTGGRTLEHAGDEDDKIR